MSETLLYPDASIDDRFNGIVSVTNLPLGEINSRSRLKQCIGDILVPKAKDHAFSLLTKDSVDADVVDVTDGLSPVKPGMNSAQLHRHLQLVQFGSISTAVDSVATDTILAAQSILTTLEDNGGKWKETLCAINDTIADLYVQTSLRFLRSANSASLGNHDRRDFARRAFDTLYLLFTSDAITPDLYQFHRDVQLNLGANLLSVPWKDHAYGVMHPNVTHARGVLKGDTRDDGTLFVRTEKSK